MSEQSSNDVAYNVVVNQRGQYSIWFAERTLPGGWHEVAIPDDWRRDFNEKNSNQTMTSKQQCLAYIETVWTDMTPLSPTERCKSACVGWAMRITLDGVASNVYCAQQQRGQHDRFYKISGPHFPLWNMSKQANLS